MIGAGLALVLLIALLTLVSYVDRVYQEIGKFLSRDFQDNIDSFEQLVEPRLGVSRERAALSMAILTQLIMASIAMIVGFTVFRDRAWDIYAVLEAGLTLILIIIIFNRLLPFVFFSRTSGRWLVHFALPLRLLIYLILGFHCGAVAAEVECKQLANIAHGTQQLRDQGYSLTVVQSEIDKLESSNKFSADDMGLIRKVVDEAFKSIRSPLDILQECKDKPRR